MSSRRRVVVGLCALPAARVLGQNSPPRWLTITVRADRPSVRAADKAPRNGPTVLDSRAAAGSSSAPAGGDGSQITGARASEQKILVLDGARAPLQFEVAVPMTFRHYAVDKDSVEEVRGTISYDTLVQFIVRAKVEGNVVTLEIEPREATLLAERVEPGWLAATAQGRLGEWIAVGGADLRDENSASAGTSRTLHAQTRTATDQRGVWFKVDLEDAGRR